MNICVFCSSSNAIDRAYFDAARTLGEIMAARGDTLVYGGADIGLMGTVAQAVKTGGGTVVGVMPTVLTEKRIVFDEADEFVTTRDMRERKAVMTERSDAFVVLPGGFGTLEELAEALTLRQIGEHEKPIVLLNTQGYYDPLVSLFEHFYREHFAHPWRDCYHLVTDVGGVFRYLDSYSPMPAPSKLPSPET